MDTRAFADELTSRFVGPDASNELAPGLDEVIAKTEGMSTPHSLTVLSLAAGYLAPEEVYLEVGTYRGRSLIGTLLNNPNARGYGVENFGEFDAGAPARAKLEGALAEFGLTGRATMIYDDAFRVLADEQLSRKVGVYFYDGVHSAFGQYAGLGLAEGKLADEAIVIVDDTSWPQVGKATDAYVDRHPGYSLIAEFHAEGQDDPVWCNGLRVYRWERPADWSGPGWDVTSRAFLQHRVTGPARTLAWRLLGDHPRALEAVRKVVTRGSTSVEADSTSSKKKH